ncbi:MAG: adenylate cyclase [Candidatus Woesearchaeota archaeon]|jgi:CYTH domain-containing protein
MIEHERKFLIKYLPELLHQCKFKEIIDIYLPAHHHNPNLRIRKNGNKYEITRKEVIDGDTSKLKEDNLLINEEEFKELEKEITGKRVHKVRYYYPYQNLIAEIDVFQGDLKGLILVEFEFPSLEEKEGFTIPEFCLVEVTKTSKEVFAGGMLCGKKYVDIEQELKKWGYEKKV